MRCKSLGSCHDSATFTSTDLGAMLMNPRDATTMQLIQAGS